MAEMIPETGRSLVIQLAVTCKPRCRYAVDMIESPGMPAPDRPTTRWVAGCMTGTSLDGIDVALAQIDGHGLDMRVTFAGHVSQPFNDSLRDQLMTLTKGDAAKPLDFMHAARSLGRFHANVIAELIAAHLPDQAKLDFVVAHGQTIWHAPQNNNENDDRQENLSWQLLDPWPIVRQLNTPVCYDLRQADLIAGGQGAPITPLADFVLFRESADFIVNLGGVCNITAWSNGKDSTPNEDSIRGDDVYPCNLIIDGLAQRFFPCERYDKDAAHARRVKQIPDACVTTMTEAMDQAIAGHQSLGREQLNAAWFDQLIQRFSSRLAADFNPNAGDDSGDNFKCTLLAAANHAIARRIVELCSKYQPTRIILAGGGARNPLLVELLKRNWSQSASVKLCDSLGVPCEAREAVGFAVLGALSQDNIPITLPQITNTDLPGRAGTWVYP